MSQQVGSADGAVPAHRDGEVLRRSLDRPARRNSLSRSMVDALVGTLTDAATDDALRVIHIRGEGGDFCAGADWVATTVAAHDAVFWEPFVTRGFSPDSGSTWLLTRLADAPTVAVGRAKQATHYSRHASAFRERRTPEFGGR